MSDPMRISDAEIDALPYRPCVGLMVLNREGKIFAGQRLNAPAGTDAAWQMPQGGIDPGEAPLDAAFRELGEETGIKAAQVNLLCESQHWRPYDLPRALLPKLWGGQFRGQMQRWFALRYTGADSAVNIDTEEPEFRTWAWMPHSELIDKIVPFKRDIYVQVFEEFADLIGTPAS